MEPRDFAVNLARQAGELISTNFRLGATKTWKSDGTPLTATDVAVNKMVISAVQATFPDHAVIGEEESASGADTDSGWAWVCDPIDGTVPFSHGIPVSTFSLALTAHGAPVLAVVAEPFLGRLFVAERGKGATLNGEPMSVSTAPNLANTVVAVEAPFDTPDGLQIRRSLREQNVVMLSMWSFVYDACLVASGELAAAIYGATHPWDTAAVALLVEEAGGRCTDLRGNAQRYDGKVNGLVVSNGQVHEDVLKAVSRGL